MIHNVPLHPSVQKGCARARTHTHTHTHTHTLIHQVPLHPSVEKGYPSHGDKKDTIPIPEVAYPRTRTHTHNASLRFASKKCMRARA